MKFAHIADVHLGNWRDPKLKDLVAKSFIKSIDKCIEERVDFVIVSGDLFHTALPSIDYIKLVIKKLKELRDANIRFYYIAGSHDFSPSGKTMLDLIEEAELGINVMKGTIDDAGKLNLDFIKDKTGAKLTGVIAKRGMLDKKYYEILDKRSLREEEGFKIFLFHTTLEELKPKELDMMDSTNISFLPRGFDYYAGGHVHIVKKADLEGYKNVVYPGPLFPANFAELQKLGYGGFYIYEDGDIRRVELKLKDVISFEFEVSSSEDANKKLEKILSQDVKDKIILIRIKGVLETGKTTDIRFKEITQSLYDKGAYHVLKNSSGLKLKDFVETKVNHSTIKELEEDIIQSNVSGKIPDETELIQNLLHSLSQERHEGEKVYEYEERIKKEAYLLMDDNEA